MRNVLANWLWLLLFGALAFGFIIGGWSASKEIPPQQHAQRASTAKGGAESQPAAVSELHTQQSHTKAGDKKEPHGNAFFGWVANFFEVKLTDLLIAVFTIVLALKTSGLFAETGRLREATDKLYLAGERQLDLLEKTSAASIKVAQDSANAAKRAADIAERAAVESDRAWVTVKPEIIGPLVFEKDRIHIGIGVDLVNIGKSPATNVEVWAEFCADIVEAKSRGKEWVDVTKYNLGDFGIVLFPNELRREDWLEVEFPTAAFLKNIADAKSRANERAKEGDENPWDASTARPAVMVNVAYRLSSSVNNRRRHTTILYEVRHKTRFHLGWDGSEGKTDLVYLELVQTFMSGQVT
jgi:hypothetical protein